MKTSTPRNLFALFAIIAAGGAQAATWYVAPGGNDSNAGSLAAPFRTVTKAVGMVNPGDAVELRAGTYTEAVILRRPGTAAAGIVLRAYAGETAVLRSSGSGPTLYFYHPDCDEDTIGSGNGNTDCRAYYWKIEGLTIQGSPAGGSDGNAVKIDVPKVSLSRNRLCCSVADIVKVVRTANDASLTDNEIWQDSAVVVPSANAQGVDIVGADRVRVARNYIHDVPNIAVYAKGNARDAVFEGNRLVNIGNAANGHALMLGQSTDAERLLDGNYESYDGIVRNNVVVNASWSCLATASSWNARFYNNSCYNTGQVTHGSVLFSNESEIGQKGHQIVLRNNVFYGSAARPVIKIGSNAMDDYATLEIDHNLYFVDGGNPQFIASDFFAAVNFAQWQTRYTQLSTRNDASAVADPLFIATSGSTALQLPAASPGVDSGAATALVRSDFRGAPRPLGSATDKGAYEFGSNDRVFCHAFDRADGC
ncbi:uncharacterized protein DUF1565 [Tahibacter aquaticus]|uniref:Uncharacterized protein DUF1565 n=1 Tax=Tahibacter aquaticus TaxID=520092 RepID=A0A4R6YYB6_9GAMM|nr:uncharacterized protein DUF1565 [Tahibacter aquaticus]